MIWFGDGSHTHGRIIVHTSNEYIQGTEYRVQRRCISSDELQIRARP